MSAILHFWSSLTPAEQRDLIILAIYVPTILGVFYAFATIVMGARLTIRQASDDEGCGR